MADTATTAPTPPTTFSRWIPSLPTFLNPFANAEATPNPDEQQPASNGLVKRPTGLSIASYNDSGHSGPPSPSRSSFFAEPSPSSNQSDRGSVDGKRSKKSRPKTSYSVCHPPPESKARQKLHRRPRSLLQLHRVSGHRRPLPAYDVIPSANFSVRMHSAVGKVFRSRHGLCPNDMVVLQAEKYGNVEDENDQEARNVIGLICKGGRGGKDKDDNATAGRKPPRVLMATSGEEWESKTLPNGGYEFFCPDSHGLGQTIRWIPKRNKDGSTVGRDGTRKFNFSTISPNTRRHPVIASLSKTALDINDTYKLPDPAGGTPVGTPQKSPPILLDEDEDPIDSAQQAFTPDQPLRDLITLTAIWVTFKEGWSASLKFDEAMPSAPGSPNKPFHLNHGHVPSLTSLNSLPGSPNLSSGFAGGDKRTNSMKAFSSDLMRKTSLLGNDRNKRNSANAASDDGGDATRDSSVATAAAQTGRSRADSSSTVLVHRAASNRRRNNQMKEMEGNAGTLEEVSSKREEDRRNDREDEGESESESDEGDEDEVDGERMRERKVSMDLSKSRGGSGSTMGTASGGAPAGVQAPASDAVNGTMRGRKKDVVRMRDGGEGEGRGKKTGWKKLFCGVAK